MVIEFLSTGFRCVLQTYCVRWSQPIALVLLIVAAIGCGWTGPDGPTPPDLSFLENTVSRQSAAELQALAPWFSGTQVFPVDEICSRLEKLSVPFTCGDVVEAFSAASDDKPVRSSALRLSDYLAAPSQSVGLAVSVDGNIGVVLQTAEVNGKTYATFVQGSEAPYLVSLKDLRDSQSVVFFVEEVQPSKFMVDATSFQVDRLVHDAGVQRPFDQVKTQFKIRNHGPGLLFVANSPKSSCSCTVGKIEVEKGIAPGETRTLDVAVHTKDKPFRQPILVTLKGQEGASRKTIAFQVVGVVPKSMHVQPTSIRFAEDNRDNKRTVHLSEVAEDRFEILGATLSSSVPGDVSIEEGPVSGKPNLKSFCIAITLPDGHVWPAAANGELTIRTTSRLRPTIQIPVYVPPRQQLTASPATVVFGSLDVSDAVGVTKTVTIRHPTSEIELAAILSVPEGLTADLVNDAGGNQLIVGVSPNIRSGLLNDRIRVHVRFDDEQEVLDIKCVGLFR